MLEPELESEMCHASVCAHFHRLYIPCNRFSGVYIRFVHCFVTLFLDEAGDRKARKFANIATAITLTQPIIRTSGWKVTLTPHCDSIVPHTNKFGDVHLLAQVTRPMFGLGFSHSLLAAIDESPAIRGDTFDLDALLAHTPCCHGEPIGL